MDYVTTEPDPYLLDLNLVTTASRAALPRFNSNYPFYTKSLLREVTSKQGIEPMPTVSLATALHEYYLLTRNTYTTSSVATNSLTMALAAIK